VVKINLGEWINQFHNSMEIRLRRGTQVKSSLQGLERVGKRLLEFKNHAHYLQGFMDVIFFEQKNKRSMVPKSHRFDSVSIDRIDGLPLRFSPSLYLADDRRALSQSGAKSDVDCA